MIRKTLHLACKFSKAPKIPRPRDPTVAESFETKLSDEQIKILIDPKGFMSEQEKTELENKANINQTVAGEEVQAPKEAVSISSTDKTRPAMQPEYGYKPKGPEPTRFGDWQVKGKCVDF